ncbi:MAG: C39 family peptidase [Oscillospiraceae bacterium]|nr:C39 family peptidase [Oscillospiraceae bacterium]
MDSTKKTAIAVISTFAVIIAVMIILIPFEKKNQIYEKWGSIAVRAETDERAEYIIENEELYPEELIHMLRVDPDLNLDYVYNYVFHKDDYKTMSYTAEELDGRIPALYMDDPRWAYQTFNGSFVIRTGGCGYVALTMAYIALTGKTDWDPYKFMLLADSMDAMSIFGGGFSNDKIAEAAEIIGLKAAEYSFFNENRQKETHADITIMKDIIDSGHVLLASMDGETFGAHLIIIRGYEGDSFYINDPDDRENTARLWSYDELDPEMRYMWDLSA